MDEIESYLQASLRKDAKLCVSRSSQFRMVINREKVNKQTFKDFLGDLQKFIENTLENGPVSDNDEDVINKQNLSFLQPMNFDQESVGTNCGSSSIDLASTEMNQSMAFDSNMSSFVPNVSENEPELSFYFAESNDFERDCASTHVRRLKRELKDSAKRKRERHEQPKQRQFSGKAISGNISVIRGMKPKHLRSRQRKKPSGAENFDKA